MANGILDALSKHGVFSETLDTLNKDPSTAHQMKGFDFAQNFPGAVPGGVYTPTSFLGPMLSKGYQYGQEIGKSILDGPGNYTIGQAIDNAGIQSDANIEGMLEKGFDMDTYNQNVKDFNIADVNFANSFGNPLNNLLSRTYGEGLASLFGSNAMADQSIAGPQNFSETNDLAGLDMDRFAGVSSLGRNDMDVEQVNQLGSPSRFQGFKNQMSNFIDNPVTKSLGTALNFARGSLPGMVMSGLGSLFSRNPNAPSYQSRSPNINYRGLNTTNLNDFYDNNPLSDTYGTTRFDRATPGSFASFRTLADYFNRDKDNDKGKDKDAAPGTGAQGPAGGATNNGGGNPTGGSGGSATGGGFCFDPSTPIQMADGSTKQIKNIQLGDDTKGGEVTGVFQFKAADEIHDYKGVTVAGSHFVKEDGRFIMVKDSPLAVKIDKIPVVYSLDTSGRRIFIKDIEFADYNGDGVAKNFLNNAGVDLTGFDKEVLRQVEHRLI